MRKAAENLEFEEAARLRDEVKRLEAVELEEAVKMSGRSPTTRLGHSPADPSCICGIECRGGKDHFEAVGKHGGRRSFRDPALLPSDLHFVLV
jgi:excinuclease UvrABC nuclease subunit